MAARSQEPNLFELRGSGAVISWAKTSLAGGPQLVFEDGEHDTTLGRDDLRVFKSPLGRLVTGTLEAADDGDSLTLSVVIPSVNLQDAPQQRVRTLAVLTTERGSIGGPGLLEGQVQLYKVLRLSGTARRVES